MLPPFVAGIIFPASLRPCVPASLQVFVVFRGTPILSFFFPPPFRSFLSLFIAIKEKEKDISKNFFLFQNSSYFFFFIAIKEEKVTKKKKKRTVFYNLAVVV